MFREINFFPHLTDDLREPRPKGVVLALRSSFNYLDCLMPKMTIKLLQLRHST